VFRDTQAATQRACEEEALSEHVANEIGKSLAGSGALCGNLPKTRSGKIMRRC